MIGCHNVCISACWELLHTGRAVCTGTEGREAGSRGACAPDPGSPGLPAAPQRSCCPASCLVTHLRRASSWHHRYSAKGGPVFASGDKQHLAVFCHHSICCKVTCLHEMHTGPPLRCSLASHPQPQPVYRGTQRRPWDLMWWGGGGGGGG